MFSVTATMNSYQRLSYLIILRKLQNRNIPVKLSIKNILLVNVKKREGKEITSRLSNNKIVRNMSCQATRRIVMVSKAYVFRT